MRFSEIKKGDAFQDHRGNVWRVTKRLVKRKKLKAWARTDVGCVELVLNVGDISKMRRRPDLT